MQWPLGVSSGSRRDRVMLATIGQGSGARGCMKGHGLEAKPMSWAVAAECRARTAASAWIGLGPDWLHCRSGRCATRWWVGTVGLAGIAAQRGHCLLGPWPRRPRRDPGAWFLPAVGRHVRQCQWGERVKGARGARERAVGELSGVNCIKTRSCHDGGALARGGWIVHASQPSCCCSPAVSQSCPRWPLPVPSSRVALPGGPRVRCSLGLRQLPCLGG